MDRPIIKILYGLTLDTGKKLREAFEQGLTEKGYDIQAVCRYRKEGIFQYASQQEDLLIILEENLQGSSAYTEEEIIQLTDLGSNRIIFLMDRKHYGSSYVKNLYVCGIRDALFMEDAEPKKVMKLFLQGRTNEGARAYYGIQTRRDAEKSCNIVNEECLNAYLEYVEAGALPEDVDQRYRFAASRMGEEENRALAASLPDTVTRLLAGNEVYQFYKKGPRGKEHFRLFTRKKDKQAKPADSTEPIVPISEETIQVQEKIPEISMAPELEEDDMLATLERYRSARMSGMVEEAVCGDIFDLRISMGEYLRQIDV